MGEKKPIESTLPMADEDIKRTTILVVDDEATILMLMSDVLNAAGYRTLIASHGEEAQRLMETEEVDLVLLDLMLPGQTGIELLESFRSRFGNVPIVMITGFGKVELAIQCFKKGAIDFLSKPIMPEKLLATIKRILLSRQPSKVQELSPEALPKVPGYRFIKILGEGNMGIVYHVETGTPEETGVRQYAMKVLKVPIASDEETVYVLRRRFMTEAKAVFPIQHPNIIKVYDYGAAEDGLPFILMEFLHGDPLDYLMDKRVLSLREKCHILQQIAFALATIHDNDICHRDIKPGNIMVDKDLGVKVMDFGIARMSDSTLTPTQQIFGTPAFLSPEAFCSAKVDYLSDIFSFGSLAYEVFTENRAFDATSIASVANKIRHEDPVWPRAEDPNFPPKLESMLKKMLMKKPEKRYQSAFSIYEELQNFINGHDAPSKNIFKRLTGL